MSAKDVQASFEAWDGNKIGKISKTDFSKLFKEVGGYDQKNIDTLFEDMEVGPDGLIDYREFLKWLMAPGAAPAPSAEKGCTLRIFTVNDVYELDKLPHMKACIEQYRTDNQVVLLAGDFLGPSLLSSLDHGRSMIDMLNRVGVQYVCFGNHEQDVPHGEMLERIKESEFEWIATNMERLEMAEGMSPLPTHKVLTVKGGGQTRRIGLLGLNTNDPGLYLPRSWGGQGPGVIDPIIDKAVEFRKKLLEEEGCDVVVPMTHQVMPLDREMAEQKLGFPLIIGGHDHQLYHEEVAGATVIKMGADADTVGIIDLTWPEVGTPSGAPIITVQKHAAEEFTPDPDLVSRVKIHKHVLEELDKASLFVVPDKQKLTSRRIRLQQVSMGTVIVSALRNAFGAECAMINAGNIRGNTEYPDDLKNFTYSNLKTEMPFDSVVADMPLPGRVINETVRFTRQFALQDPPVEKGSYMQLDDKMIWDPRSNTILEIAGEPFDPDRIYECIVLWQVAMEGIDKVTPLYEYCKEHLADSLFPHDADVGRPAKQVLVDYFGRAIWWHLIESAGFSGIDSDGDGHISEKELSDAIHKCPSYEGELGDLVVKNIMAMADLDHNGFVCKNELLQVSILDLSMFEHADLDGTRMLNRGEVEVVVKKLFGDAYEASMVDQLFADIDTNQDGKLSFCEVKVRSKQLHKLLKV
jgi:2',3'-cyclic-nucleotide 2'-phosphodiesterase (5'-nucleotidase family)